MKTITDLFMLAVIVVYIVDLSGFTDSLLAFLSAYKGKKVTSFKPLSCSLCMVWWSCLLYLIVTGQLSLPFIALSALLSFLSMPIANALFAIREALLFIINKMTIR